ncbi:hypothetical protein FOC84_26765 [Achromobacter pestifer]|uniref:Uncharacterized protein n=1 Tax=Achromobacter pestifer TaxID=1353889 RepID=A0A7D4ILK4_9BURK|nr:hypothetical protein [Achromobacter pestifer]QKH38343.1 hypothetical protein FOC84_26765 [Achromobacter pestifer]
MGACKKCEAIVTDRRDAPGHENLISLGMVRSPGQTQRSVQHEAFTCALCGTDWDYLYDKRDPASGWRRCGSDAGLPIEAAVQPLARAVGAG